jgi:hypothetical protein
MIATPIYPTRALHVVSDEASLVDDLESGKYDEAFSFKLFDLYRVGDTLFGVADGKMLVFKKYQNEQKASQALTALKVETPQDG